MSSPASSAILLDHSQDIVLLLDDDGRIKFANAPVEHLLGWTPSELVGRNAFDLVHPEDVADARRAFERTTEATEFTEAEVEHRARTSDGSWTWLESRMSNLTDEGLNGYVVSARDISEQVRSRAEERETRERLEELTGATSDVMWLFDGDWSEVLFVNPAYETVYGRPLEELESNPSAFLDAIHPDDVSTVTDAMELLSDGTAVDMEYRVDPNRGYNRWIWVQGVPIVQDEEVVRIAGFSKDITERRRREIQLCVTDNLLRHNIRNDMNIILGTAEALEEELPEAATRTAVIRRTGEALLASAEKQREITQLLTSSGTPVSVDLAEVVSAAVEKVQRRFPTASIELVADDDCSGRVLREFQYAVVELLENAIVHNTHDEPTVRVTLERGEDQVTLTIEDDSTPIPELEARVLRGYHEMSAVYHSSGIGLWLVYWVVELSDGWIDIWTNPEVGNCIRLNLPRAER